MSNSPIILFLFFTHCMVCGQTPNRETDFLVKLSLFQETIRPEKYVSEQESLNNFLRLGFKIDTLQSTDFADFTFLRIDPNFRNPENIPIPELPLLIGNCDAFIVAFNGRTIYRLKGFRVNDFPYFLGKLKSLNYYKISSYWGFVNNYEVNGLDLRCLYKAFKRPININKIKHKCLLSCAELISTH